jgi:hypothetical protein
MKHWIPWCLVSLAALPGCPGEPTCQDLRTCDVPRNDGGFEADVSREIDGSSGADSLTTQPDAESDGPGDFADAQGDAAQPIDSTGTTDGRPQQDSAEAAPPDGRSQPDSSDAAAPDDSEAARDAGLETDASKCGNGSIDPPEECDDGATQNTGGYGKCNPNCTLGPRCGDGRINGSEACDNGPDNGLGLGACNPVCTGLVRQKYVKVSKMFGGTPGNLTGDWDPLCQTEFGITYKSLIVVPVTGSSRRIATITPYRGDGQVDWVLGPYTRYVNSVGDLIWATDEVRLLGVRNGRAAALQNPIQPGNADWAWGGFNDDWTASTDNCTNWTSSDGAGHGQSVRLDLTSVSTTPEWTCEVRIWLICVEQ